MTDIVTLKFWRWVLSDPSKRAARLTLVVVVAASLALSAWLVLNKVLS